MIATGSFPNDDAKEPEPYILSAEKIPHGAYSSFYRGVVRDLAILALAAASVSFLWRGTDALIGVLFGSIAAAVNFWWMQQSIIALTNAYSIAIQGQENMELAASKPKVPLQPQALKFFLRYLLIGSVTFVIMKNHRDAALGFFTGLALPIVALLLESILQLFPSSNKTKAS